MPEIVKITNIEASPASKNHLTGTQPKNFGSWFWNIQPEACSSAQIPAKHTNARAKNVRAARTGAQLKRVATMAAIAERLGPLAMPVIQLYASSARHGVD
jgi:hypothetical protein